MPLLFSGCGNIVRGFNKEAKARFLQFVTGTSKIVLMLLQGSQRPQIHKAYGSPDHLPLAHLASTNWTCLSAPLQNSCENSCFWPSTKPMKGSGFWLRDLLYIYHCRTRISSPSDSTFFLSFSSIGSTPM